MFYEIASNYTGKLSDYKPGAPIHDRSAWNSLSEKWRLESVRLGEEYLRYTYPSLSATDYMDFTRTGNRSRFEEKFFARRLALSSLTLAECVENRNRFTDDIVNGIFAVCEESGWQLPAHNTYVRDTPQLTLPDSSDPVLDLFACETGALLGTVSYLLGEQLDAVSPAISKRILDELKHRIFQPYLQKHFWWMGDGIQPMNNWTIWCTQNVLLSVFLTDTDASLRSEVFLKACRSADYFLNEYGEDGCCDEGAQYYRHAGLCLFHVIEILNAVADNAFSSLYDKPKIRNIASYILNVHISDKYYVNFADCSPVAGRAGVREFLFAERTHNANMMLFAAGDFLAGGRDTLLMDQESNLYYRLLNGFYAEYISQYCDTRSDTATHPDIYYKSVGLFVARDDTLCLAVKAGDNADSHNHNDVGSFTVYKNGYPMVIDVGVESYTQKTFSSRRYEIWTMQSAYHNLPTINGMMQRDGETYRAKDVSCLMDDSVCEISMDISGAYPAEANLEIYRRTATLYKGNKIVIKDQFAFQMPDSYDKKDSTPNGNTVFSDENDIPVILSLMTCEKPIPQSVSQGLLLRIGDLGTLSMSQGQLLNIEEIPVTDPRLQTAWEHNLYRVLVRANSFEQEIEIY